MTGALLSCDFLVVGGGAAGICAAVQAGRLGMNVVLVEKETFLGGNGGPNLGVGATGALTGNPYWNETGVVEEIEELVTFHGARQPPVNGVAYNIDPLWDSVVAGLLRDAGVKVLRRHLLLGAAARGRRIAEVETVNLDTLERVGIAVGGFAVDATGDAALAALAGAATRMGREGRDELGERSAPPAADRIVSAASLTALAVDVGEPSPFVPPPGTPPWNPEKPHHFDPRKRVHFLFQVDEGGESEANHPLLTPQALHDRLRLRIYSLWNHFKNVQHPDACRNHRLVWISPVLGKRESRRILGDFTLSQTDLEARRRFDDVAGFGGHWIDEHLPSFDGGYEVEGHSHPLPFEIPLRCLYSRDFDNLFSAGRAIGVSHLAFASTRIIRTGGLLGQSVAVAADLCRRLECTPRTLASGHAPALRQALLVNDVFLPGQAIDYAGTPLAGAVAASASEATILCRRPTDWRGAGADDDGVGVLLYDYPERVAEARVWLRNPAASARTVTARLAFGQSPAPIYRVNAPVPEGVNPAAGRWRGFAHHGVRKNEVTEFSPLAEARITVPAGFEGPATFAFGRECPVPARDPGRFLHALRLRVEGEVEVGLSPAGVDLHEGVWEGRAHPERTPSYDWGGPWAVGAAARILDGHIHREGRGPDHAWMSEPGEALPQAITVSLPEPRKVGAFTLTFDTTEASWRQMFVFGPGRASRKLAADYRWEWTDAEGRSVSGVVRDNPLRFRRHVLERPLQAVRLRVTVERTWGPGEPARLYSVFAE